IVTPAKSITDSIGSFLKDAPGVLRVEKLAFSRVSGTAIHSLYFPNTLRDREFRRPFRGSTNPPHRRCGGGLVMPTSAKGLPPIGRLINCDLGRRLRAPRTPAQPHQTTDRRAPARRDQPQ